MHGRSYVSCAAMDLTKIKSSWINLINFFVEKMDFRAQTEYTESVQTDKVFHWVLYRKLLLDVENIFVKTKILRWEGSWLRKGCQEAPVGVELVTSASFENLS